MIDYSTYTVTESYEYPDTYSEEGQVSNIKFATAYVDHKNKVITQNHTPFKCREFLSDWVCSNTSGSRICLYGFVHYPEKSGPNPLEVLVIHGPEDELSLVWDRAKCCRFAAYVSKNTLGNKKVIILKIPEKVFRSPFGTMTFTCLFRAMGHKDVGLLNAFGEKLYFPMNECSEQRIISVLISAVPSALVHKLMFDQAYYKYLAVMQPPVEKNALGSFLHAATGPKSMAQFLNKQKADRVRVKNYITHQVVLDQYNLLESALRKAANG